MKNLKPYLLTHQTGADAVERTKKNNVIAVVVKTYLADSKVSEEFYSFKTKAVTNEEIYNAFPLSLGSNQSIEEIDANDF